ncbi:MAG: DNA photolyase [Calditrichaeota bacterium]|nr:MAG: DNA photolyase [Calditrichota bacterium]
MAKDINYSEKFESFRGKTLYERLRPEQQAFLQQIAFHYRLTFQEFRQVVDACRDLEMWGVGFLADWWEEQTATLDKQGVAAKKQLLTRLQSYLTDLRKAAKKYPEEGLQRPKKREKSRVVTKASEKKVFGMCPVASPRTVCCNLRTIDVVENCIFGCSYCTIQTFYHEEIVFDANLGEKLRQIQLEPDRFYHIGTGQSSDSLAWGNRNGILDDLCGFAADHPNILLEFKTKSNNIRYFLENQVPPNIVCSWSLNTPTIIKNEEHFTASLEERIKAARQVADQGIRVAFHFHPMVYYSGWDEDYPRIAHQLLQLFSPEEVLFISFGSVTLIKPVMQQIRKLGHPTKILQMEFVKDPHGKFTYPDHLKVHMFRTMYNAFSPWHEKVFFYLCMEKAEIWMQTFGYVYESNEQFEEALARSSRMKLSMESVLSK